MPGSRRGAPGNLNGVRNPWNPYWRRRALKKEDRWVLALVRDYVPSLVADKGGADNVSFAEMKVMELAAVARVCWALAMSKDNHDAVGRFINIERQALADIGLARRARQINPLDAVRAAVEAANQPDGTGQPDGEGQP